MNYGNNDFIELRSGDDTYLSPYPHKQIEFTNLQGQQVWEQSNGIWFTKARGDTEDVFRYTPDADHVARCNIGNFSDNPLRPEAKYPDGEYTLKFFAQDDFGRVNRDLTSGWDVNAQLKFIVDNFRPFVRKVKIDSGTFPIYSSEWKWMRNGNTGTLALSRATDTRADRAHPLNITVNTSEPMIFTTTPQGDIQDSVQIKLTSKSPFGNMTTWLDWRNPQTVSADRRIWSFLAPRSTFPPYTAGFENYTQILSIRGNDLAGNRLIEYDGSFTSYTGAQIPARTGDPNAPWTSDPSFSIYSGIDTVHRFQLAPQTTFAGRYGAAAYESASAIWQTTDGGYIVAGDTRSFGVGSTDLWLLKLDAFGDVEWEQTYGGPEFETAKAVQQT